MDIASLIGMGAGVLMVFGAILSGGNPGDYINVQGIMIVLGGTVSATLLNFRMSDVLRAYGSVAHVFSSQREKPIDTLIEVMRLNDMVRRHGRLALNKYSEHSGNKMKNRIMAKAIQLSVDNLSHEDIVVSLRTEIDSVKVRDTINQEVFKKMAVYAPSMGMIGTLIGLVEMLGSMTNPAELGPAMALALITTFYGAFFATLIFLPIAGKLRVVMLESVVNLEIIYEGAISLATNGSVMVLYERAVSYIPEEHRISFDDLKEIIDIQDGTETKSK